MTELRRWSERPRILVVEGVLDEASRTALVALCRDEATLEAAGISLHRTECGVSAELPSSHHPALSALASRLTTLLGIANACGETFRMRRYGPGEGHPPHLDTYTIDGQSLVATALVCLHAPERGGETVFLDAPGGPLALPHRAGVMLAWHDLDADGRPDPASRHLAAPVAEGEKLILTWFVYARPEALASAASGVPDPRAGIQARVFSPRLHPTLPGLGRRLAIVDDGVPAETVSLLSSAAEERGIAVTVIDAERFDFSSEPPLRAGDLLHRPAVSMHAMQVEQHLWHEDVGSFYLDREGPLVANIAPLATFARHGISVPRSFPLARADRPMLRRYVDALGGLPVVLKVPGYSRGIGVLRADSLASLFSLVDYVLAQDHHPVLTSYVPEAEHWRLVVVGDRVVASYRNPTDADDFRTSSSGRAEDYEASPPEGADAMAVAACRALRVAHGGVDLLAHPSGRLYLLEANFPCYYADAQLAAGVDVAGAMIDYLLDIARRRAPAE